MRSNNSKTALNESIALELLGSAGLATQRSSFVRFTVNSSKPALRLVIESPNDEWTRAQLGDGLLYKSDAQGDWSYRGEDPTQYDGPFSAGGR